MYYNDHGPPDLYVRSGDKEVVMGIESAMLKDVVEVKPLGDYRLYVRFEDNVDGEIDLSEIVQFKGVLESLRDRVKFQEVAVNRELGTICWPNGADVAPDVLYAKLTKA